MGLFDKMKDAMSQSIAAMPTMADAKAINEGGQDIRRLLAEGIPGRAVITSCSDTGERLAGNAVLSLGLRVTMDHGDTYDLLHRMTIAGTDLEPYAVGKEYAVKVDPSDRDNLTFSGY